MKRILDQVEGIKWPGATCIENAYAALMSYYGDDCELLFGEVLGIHVNPQENDRLVVEEDMPGVMEGVFYYKRKEIPEFDYIAMKDYVDDGIPLLVEVDAFNVPYLKQYKKYHHPHTLLIHGYDEKFFYCVDPNITTTQEKRIALEDLAGCYKFGYAFSKKGCIDNMLIYNNSIKKILNEDYMREYDMLLCRLKKNAVIRQGIEGYDSEDLGISPLFLQIKRIAGKHYLFTYFIDFFEQKYGERGLSGLKNELEKIGENWHNYRMKLIHMLLTDPNAFDKLGIWDRYLDEIYCMEEAWRVKLSKAYLLSEK